MENRETNRKTKDMTNQELNDFQAQFGAEDLAEATREERLRSTFDEDIAVLRNLANAGTGVSEICTQILTALRDKSGKIDVGELRTLDNKNRVRALRLIDVLCTPSLISDGPELQVT